MKKAKLEIKLIRKINRYSNRNKKLQETHMAALPDPSPAFQDTVMNTCYGTNRVCVCFLLLCMC